MVLDMASVFYLDYLDYCGQAFVDNPITANNKKCLSQEVDNLIGKKPCTLHYTKKFILPLITLYIATWL